MAPNPAAARTSEKSPKTPEIAGDIAAVALPAAGLIVSLAVGDRQGVKQLALACAADLAVGYDEIRDRQIPAGRTRRAGLPVHSLGGRLRRSIVYPTTLRLEIRSSGLPRWPSMSAGAASEPARENTTFGTCSPERLWERAAVTCLRSPTANGEHRSPCIFPIGSVGECVGSAPPSCSESSKRKRANRTRSPGGTVPAFFYRALSETDKPFRRASESISPKKRAATGGRASTGCRFRLSSDLRTRPTGRLACRTKANAAMSVIQKIVHPRGLIAKPIRQ